MARVHQVQDYKVTVEVEAHDPSDEYSEEEPTRLTFLTRTTDEEAAMDRAREAAASWVRSNWGDVGYTVTIIRTNREVA